MSRACRSRALGRSHDRIRGTPQERPRDPVGRSRGLQPPGHDGGQRRRHHDDRCGRLRHRTVRRAAHRCQLRGHLRLRRRRPRHARTTPCPTAVSDSPLAGFPTVGPTYSILTSGDAALADDPNIAGGDGYGWNVPATAIGAGVYDYQVVRIDLPAASTACLAFDFRFLSDEYPEYVNTQLQRRVHRPAGHLVRHGRPGHATVTAPGNFAGGAGDIISVDAGGPERDGRRGRRSARPTTARPRC